MHIPAEVRVQPIPRHLLRLDHIKLLPKHGHGEAVKIVASQVQIVPLHPLHSELVQIHRVLDLDSVPRLEPLCDLGHVRAQNDDPRVLEEGLEELGRVVERRHLVPYPVSTTVIRELVHEAVGSHTESEEVVGLVRWVKGTRTVVDRLFLGYEANEDGVWFEGCGGAGGGWLGVGSGGPEDLLEPLGGDVFVVGDDGQDAIGVHSDGEEVLKVLGVGADDHRLRVFHDGNVEHHFRSRSKSFSETKSVAEREREG